jgi:methyl-accepting chemotaxis protein
MRNLTLSKKMIIFALIVILILIVTLIGKVNSLGEIKKDFNEFSSKIVDGKIATLNIQANLNYVSRCTRDIMLGNAYSKNIKKIESRINLIKNNFKILKQTVKNTPNENEKLHFINNTQISTMAFVNDGLNKMKSLKNTDMSTDTRASMYQQYKKDATPLAKKSRKLFGQIIKIKNEDLIKRTEIFKNKISSVNRNMIIESIVIILTIGIYLIFITKEIVGSIHNFQHGLLNFFDFLNKKTIHISNITVKNNDEIGEMSKVVNENILKTKKLIDQDKELINDVKRVVSLVKEGHIKQTITKSTTNKDLEELKHIFNEMLEIFSANVSTDINKLQKALDSYQKLDFSHRIPDATGKTAIGLNTLANIINKMLMDNKINGLTLQDSATTLLKNVEVLSSSSSQTATSLEETSIALEKVTSNIRDNTNNVIAMANYGNEVKTSVNSGQELANRTTIAMDEINNEVEAISDAISVIDQIAFQTNILSLNAAVEAATAGEAGKGFAVVAQEVRNLASRSAEAANEIKKLVENATSKANNGKNIADEMIDGYTHLNNSIIKTLGIISSVERASKGQQIGIEQINNTIIQLDRQTQQNVNIASATQSIALQTQNIAQDIVAQANEKEFIGKQDVREINSANSH